MNEEEAKALFSKYINNQCSEKEIELLDAFLDSYQGNKISDTTYDEKIIESKTKVWNSISTSIDTKPKQKKVISFRKYTIYSIAAACLIILCTLPYFLQNTAEPKPTTTAKNNITIGTDKAILTLENGENIVLEKDKSFTNSNSTSNGKSLVYNNLKNESTKISYNYLTIPRGGEFYMEISDGTKIWLNSESKIKFPVQFVKGKTREVELIYGEAYFEVSSSKKHEGSKFTVNSNHQNIEVLGTQFNVKAYKDDEVIYTTLVEGKIMLDALNQNRILQPNEQAIFNLQEKTVTLSTVNTYNETSWKEGVFSFKGKSLKELMKVISRWYDVEVVFENKNLESMTFRGILGKDQPITEVLTAIKSASIINSYEIKNKTIYIK